MGFSDAALLLVSIVGFGFLTAIMYSLIFSRALSREEFDEAQETAEDYNDRLDRADVATLNRAQRRARAKNIMKRQRRMVVEDPAAEEEGNDDDAPPAAPAHEGHLPHPSRKERQRAAKEAERHERKLLEEERQALQRQAQQEAQREKEARQRREAQAAQEEKERRLQEEQEHKRAAEKEWKTFLSYQKDVLTVLEFDALAREQQTVSIDGLAERFRVPSTKIRERIEQLVAEGRLTGLLRDSDEFVSLSDPQLEAIAHRVRQEAYVTPRQISDIFQSVITESPSTES